MSRTETWNLVNHASGLTRIRDGFKHRYQAGCGIGFAPIEYSESDRRSVGVMDEVMRPWLIGHNLVASIDRLDRVMEYANDADCHIDDLADRISILMEVLEDELKRQMFLYLTPTEVRAYSDPYAAFPRTVTAFHSACYDIIGASQCLALGQSSASVFHCMGILQYGLFALADEVEAKFKISVEMETWLTVIRRIEDAIKAMENDPKSKAKDDTLKFYSQAAIHFRFFKDAWRNHVCHLRERYDELQAQSILNHVAEFMEQLSLRLKEVPLPVATP